AAWRIQQIRVVHQRAKAVGGGRVHVGDRGIHGVWIDAAGAEGGELELARKKGADYAVFGTGAGIDREHHARTIDKRIGIAVMAAGIAVPGRLAVGGPAVDGDVG